MDTRRYTMMIYNFIFNSALLISYLFYNFICCFVSGIKIFLQKTIFLYFVFIKQRNGDNCIYIGNLNFHGQIFLNNKKQTSHLENREAKVVYEGQRSNLLTLRTPEECLAERAVVHITISSKRNELHVYPTYNVKIILHSLCQCMKLRFYIINGNIKYCLQCSTVHSQCKVRCVMETTGY